MKKHLMAATLASLSLSALAAQPTGLKPVTTKELRKMQKEQGLRRIKKVKPNSVGLARINEVRARLGLPLHAASKASPMGKDTDIDTNSDYDFETLVGADTTTSELLMGSMPTAVDNSTLPAFPAIGAQAWNNCAAWAMGYYQFTHNNGLALGWVNNNTDKTRKCSPKFIYNQINSGVDNGSYWSDNFSMLQKHGCVTWANWPEDNDYKSWNTNPDHWRSAIPFRSNGVQYIYNIDTQAGLDQMKQLLNNGYLLTYGTYINSWQYTTIKSGNLAGSQALTHVNGTNGSHAMTVVGYDDNVWVDINNNNSVDAGEMGVLKIANSWGTNWGHAGFMYVAYDALKAASAVAGGPSAGRGPAFQNKMVYHIPVKAQAGVSYSPKYLARFTVNHAAINQMSVKFGWSSTNTTAATTTYTPFALTNKGGAYAFNGTTTPVDGTFVMDISELPFNTYDNKIYLTVSDNAYGSPATLKSFEVIDVVNGTQVAAYLATAKTADGASTTATVNLVPSVANASPAASFTASTYSATAPVTINFDGAGSSDSDGTISAYSWNFGDGTTATGAYASKTYSTAGTYTVTLTVKDDDGASASTSKTVTISTAVVTDTIKPTVTLTSPVSGSRYARYTTVTAQATASDNKGVSKVRFYVNGYLKCTDSYAPYTCPFSMPYGSNIPVRARAYDAAGNYTTSSTSYISN